MGVRTAEMKAGWSAGSSGVQKVEDFVLKSIKINQKSKIK